MNAATKKFISCGMYAFNAPLQQAWQSVFSCFIEQLDDRQQVEPGLRFDFEEDVLRDPRLLLGHTCGYPLMARMQDALVPICAPVFDAPGCEGPRYSSLFVVAIDSDLYELADCRGRIAAFNDPTSNSGMNVLRHAVSQLEPGEAFFSALIESGGHLKSIRAIDEGRADVAAIDCVSYRFFQDYFPELTARLRSIGNSASSPGLPLVVPVRGFSNARAKELVDKLNTALERVSAEQRQLLHLRHFAPVSTADYASILQLESYAVEKGYPRLK